jgi:hypothetical protein
LVSYQRVARMSRRRISFFIGLSGSDATGMNVNRNTFACRAGETER